MLLMFLVSLPLESPRFLLMQGRRLEAEEVLHKLLDDDEARELLAAWAAEPQGSDTVESTPWFTFFAGVGAMATQSMVGVNVTTVYIDRLTTSQSPTVGLVVGLTRVLVVGITLRYIDMVSRRRLLQVSTAGVAVVSFASACFAWASLAVPWRILGLSVYFVFYESGVGPAAWVYVGEVFDSSVRGRGASLSVTVARVLGGCFMLGFPYSERFLGLGNSWLIIALSSLCTLVFVQLALPETKGVPLEAIGKLMR